MSLSVPDSLASQLTFKPPTRSFVIHNAKKHAVELMYVGNLMTVPPRDKAGPRSDTDSDNIPIPGTYVIEDIYGFDEESGDDQLVFDAARCISHLLGIKRDGEGKPAVATSTFAQGGLSLLPRHAPRELVDAVAAAGGERAFEREVVNAHAHLDAVEQRNNKRKSMGLDPVPPDRFTRAAMELVRKHEAMRDQVQTPELDALKNEAVDLMIDEEIEIEAIARAKALDMAKKHGGDLPDVEQRRLFEHLLNQPSVRKWAQKEHRWRRRGHKPIDEELLDAAAEAGQSVKDIEDDE